MLHGFNATRNTHGSLPVKVTSKLNPGINALDQSTWDAMFHGFNATRNTHGILPVKVASKLYESLEICGITKVISISSGSSSQVPIALPTAAKLLALPFPHMCALRYNLPSGKRLGQFFLPKTHKHSSTIHGNNNPQRETVACGMTKKHFPSRTRKDRGQKMQIHRLQFYHPAGKM